MESSSATPEATDMNEHACKAPPKMLLTGDTHKRREEWYTLYRLPKLTVFKNICSSEASLEKGMPPYAHPTSARLEHEQGARHLGMLLTTPKPNTANGPCMEEDGHVTLACCC
jgi:hypothetical protein